MSRAIALAKTTEPAPYFGGTADVVIPQSAWSSLPAIAQRALVMLRADGIAIALRTKGRMTCCATAGELAPAVGVLVDEDSGFAGECMRTRRTLLCADTSKDARVNRSIASAGLGGVLAAPLSRGELVFGVIEAMSADVQVFRDADQRVIECFARELLTLIEAPSMEAGALTVASSLQGGEEVETELPLFLTTPAEVGHERRRLKWGVGIAIMASAIGLVAVNLHHDDANAYPAPVAEAAVINQTYLDSLQKSAQNGNVGAQSALGTFYWTGRGIAQDDVAAYMWSTIAAAQGDVNSKQRLELLRNSMPSASVAAGERRAQQWMRGHSIRRESLQ
jgi:hypothetical protein